MVNRSNWKKIVRTSKKIFIIAYSSTISLLKIFINKKLFSSHKTMIDNEFTQWITKTKFHELRLPKSKPVLPTHRTLIRHKEDLHFYLCNILHYLLFGKVTIFRSQPCNATCHIQVVWHAEQSQGN